MTHVKAGLLRSVNEDEVLPLGYVAGVILIS